MKKMLVLFTLLTLSLFSTESLTAHVPNAIAIDCIMKAAPGGAYLTIAGKFGGKITKSEIAKITALDIQGCAAGAKIFQYVLVIKKGGKSQSLKGDSASLTKEMQRLLKELSKGDEFTFTDVKAHLNSTDDVDVWAKKFVII